MSESFMVSVDGTAAPSREHASFSLALTEGLRLSRSPSTHRRKIRILREVAVIDNVSPSFISNLKILDRAQLISVGELLDLINAA